ncbi:MAG: hypothetical protein WCP16_02520 [Pseudanabaena sp. ELA645]
MSKVLISSLIAEINLLLSRPVGSVSKKASSEVIHQREQLKQLRAQLESLPDDSQLRSLDKQYQGLVTGLQDQIQSQIQNQSKSHDKQPHAPISKTDKLEVSGNLFGNEFEPIMETSSMTSSTPEPNSTFVNDRMIATLQQAIQQTLQQVVKDTVQQSIQQVVSQTLAVERALMVGEISTSLNKIVEAQQRSQISQELITLNQQKQKLNAEILQLESDRTTWMQQFQEFQTSQQQSLDRSLQSVNTHLQEQVSQTVARTLQDNLVNLTGNNLTGNNPAAINSPTDSPSQEEEFVNKVQEQTDRFLVHLDEMFSSTFRSLEKDIQGYQTSIEAKLGHIETLEQKGEALINALVDRISQQNESPSEKQFKKQSESLSEETSQSEPVIVNVLPELPDDIPLHYLETVTEPVDENLISSLLAGNEFGESIAEPIVESPVEPHLEPTSDMSIDTIIDVEPIVEVAATNDEVLVADNLDLDLGIVSEKLENPEQADRVDSLLNISEEEIGVNVTEIESILGAPPESLFESSVDEDTELDSYLDEVESNLSIESNQLESIFEDRLEFESNKFDPDFDPDFDVDAATHIFENLDLPSLENNQSLNIDDSEGVLDALSEARMDETVNENENNSDVEIDDPDLLQWLEESSDRPHPSNIAEITADEDLMSWLDKDSLDMAKLPTTDPLKSQESPKQFVAAPISELATFDPVAIASSEAQQVSDQANDSDESLILLTNESIDDLNFPAWEDSLVDVLNSDLERLGTGGDIDPLMSHSLDQFIRNTPYSLTNWETQNPQTFPTIIDISAQSANSANSDRLPTETSLQLTEEELRTPLIKELNHPVNHPDEKPEIVIDIDDSQASPFIAKANEIPEIFDNPDALFDASDDMDAIFAEVIAETAAKYSQATPFETNDEIDELFTLSNESGNSRLENSHANASTNTSENLDLNIDLNNESELDTLLFGFDPVTEIESSFNDFDNLKTAINPNNLVGTQTSPQKTTNDFDTMMQGLPQGNHDQKRNPVDTVMQGLSEIDYEEIDVGAVTFVDAMTFSEPIKFIEEELDTILQGFAYPEIANFPNPSQVTSFPVVGESPTFLDPLTEDLNFNATQQNSWQDALEELEVELSQPSSHSDQKDKDRPQSIELSADEFFASLEYDRLNVFADKPEKVVPSVKAPNLSVNSPSNAIADLADLDDLTDLVNFDNDLEAEDLLLNEFADAQREEPNDQPNNKANSEWDELLNDLESFNFNQPLLDDRREQLGLSSVAPITDSLENVLDIDSLVMESSSAPLIPSPPEKEVYSLDDTWILGVDFGSTALRASLFNSNTGRVYSLRFDAADEMPCKLAWTENHSLDDPISKDIRVLTNKIHSTGLEEGEVAIVHFKQFLKLGLPYRGVSTWQPIVQWSDSHQASLRWLIAALKNLLEQIQTRANHPRLPDVGMILLKLSGVVFGYPSNWSDTYILNVREAILKSGLVSQAEQVTAVEQAIAPVLSLIHDHKLHDQKISQEITLFIDAGAVTTSLCLTKGIEAKESDRSKLHIRSLDYAGISINQDIILKLFYPHWQLITNPNRHLCKFDHLNLPEIGATATQERTILQQYLLSSTIGQQMLELADRVKITFGKDMGVDSWNEELMGQPIVVLRRELENFILQPFIQRLNRELNSILSNAGIIGEDIRQVLLLGSTMHIPSLSRWLAQKLPKASINPLATSVLASGLAVSPLYPNLQDIVRQQYSDYFLLQEICRLNLTKSINPTQLLQQLQNRGVNIKACRDRILTILQGDLPEGLFPWQEPEQAVILGDPTLSSDLFAGQLFELETDGTYQPNVTKFQQLRVYLQAIISNMSQTLNEPLVFPEIKIH